MDDEDIPFVLKGAKQSLLGNHAAWTLGLVTVNIGDLSGVCKRLLPECVESGRCVWKEHGRRSLRKATEEGLRDLQRKGTIEPAPPISAWMSPIEFVPKGSNDFRIVIVHQPKKAIKRTLHLLKNFKQSQPSVAWIEVVLEIGPEAL